MLIKRLAIYLLAAATIGFAGFWIVSSPEALPTDEATIKALTAGDAKRGETAFWAGGCASCHSDKGAEGDARLMLGGGYRLETPYGVFVAPNISPDAETGIGNWNAMQFANAMIHGVSPDGKHYYPAFPYTSYNKMSLSDVADLFAYLKTLPPIARLNEPNELGLLYSWRRPLGVWKRMFADRDWISEIDEADAQLQRGRYLVEGPGHCGECHTPRNLLGAMKKGNWLAGGPAPEGDGRIPNITPHEKGIKAWSAGDIAYYLESGFTPDYDFVGGSMVSVQKNMAKLPKSDREAIAAYLKAATPANVN